MVWKPKIQNLKSKTSLTGVLKSKTSLTGVLKSKSPMHETAVEAYVSRCEHLKDVWLGFLERGVGVGGSVYFSVNIY